MSSYVRSIRSPLIATGICNVSLRTVRNRQSERSKSTIGGCASKPRSFQRLVGGYRFTGDRGSISYAHAAITYYSQKIRAPPGRVKLGFLKELILVAFASQGSIDTSLRQHLIPPSSTWHQSVRSISRVIPQFPGQRGSGPSFPRSLPGAS